MLVLAASNEPRISAGAPGLGSNVSCCVGPPGRYTMMSERSLASWPDWDWARSKRPMDNPPSPSEPILKKLRRDSPSQNRSCRFPKIVSTTGSPAFSCSSPRVNHDLRMFLWKSQFVEGSGHFVKRDMGSDQRLDVDSLSGDIVQGRREFFGRVGQHELDV